MVPCTLACAGRIVRAAGLRTGQRRRRRGRVTRRTILRTGAPRGASGSRVSFAGCAHRHGGAVKRPRSTGVAREAAAPAARAAARRGTSKCDLRGDPGHPLAVVTATQSPKRGPVNAPGGSRRVGCGVGTDGLLGTGRRGRAGVVGDAHSEAPCRGATCTPIGAESHARRARELRARPKQPPALGLTSRGRPGSGPSVAFLRLQLVCTSTLVSPLVDRTG